MKSLLRKELVAAIRTVYAGQRHIPPEIAAQIAEHCGDDGLAEREVAVLRHVAAGCSNKRVAAQLAISEETVKAYMRSLLSKLGAEDRTHAVVLAVKRGIVDV